MPQILTVENENTLIKRAPAKLQRGEAAKLVAQGVFFKLWQWPQELYDGSIATFESLSRPDTVTFLALTAQQEILVTRQSQPGFQEFMSFPGGVIDSGESVLQAAQRELLEETGHASTEWYFLFSKQMNSRIDWANFYLLAKNCQKQADLQLDAGEKISLEFWPLQQLSSLSKQKNFRQSDFALWYWQTDGAELKQFI
jgi:8-oxo-dGTP pyrophosphatase MutT (NUDIX family)